MPRTYSLVLAGVLAACGGGSAPGPRANVQANSTTQPVASAGQVAPAAASAKVSFYAASRFAEQVSFGPTPALVAEIQAKGFEKWIDDQFALPMSRLDVAQVAEAAPGTMPEKNAYVRHQFGTFAMTAADQLRLRTTWSLSQFLVVRGTNTGAVTWFNLLQDHAFGNYGALLKAISIDPTMGAYLNNVDNRPKSANCPTCTPNENYAREWMQLFSLGVFKLKDDGTPLLDNRGRVQETYTQADVESLARVLTGWQFDIRGNGGEWYELRFARKMLPSPFASERDAGAKRVMGTTFAAGQSHEKDLDDAVAMLMSHPNIAPFVGLRLIQNLVMSNPSPAYMSRVVARFRSNGAGVAGDMKAVLKAVLLDDEARRGDNPGVAHLTGGKYREPFLWYWAFFRAIDCQRSLYAPRPDGLDPYWQVVQNPFGQNSVFGYYQGTDRSPGSNLLAPEQRLVTSEEMRQRMYQLRDFHAKPGEFNTSSMLDRSSCDVPALVQAYTTSKRAFSDFISQRFFKGAMPPALRQTLEEKMYQPYLPTQPASAALDLLAFVLSSPYFAVML
jgi:uncharacterized protein (DUF1800 family)